MRFSEREGYKKPIVNTLKSIDEILRNHIWTEIYETIYNNFISRGTSYLDADYVSDKAKMLWTKFFNKSISNLPYPTKYLQEVELLFENLEWYEVYDLVEFLLWQLNDSKLTNKFNKILEENGACYRIINNIVQPITCKFVIEKIGVAYSTSSEEVKEHLKKAENFYSKKQNPDFVNACLESIKAVEACCRSIYKNRDTLGDNIKALRKTNADNKHIINVLDKINAFRGDDAAHAKKSDGYSPKIEDAVLIHTICCAFINYFKISKNL